MASRNVHEQQQEQLRVGIAIGITVSLFTAQQILNNQLGNYPETALLSVDLMILVLGMPWWIYLLNTAVALAPGFENGRLHEASTIVAKSAYSVGIIMIFAGPLTFALWTIYATKGRIFVLTTTSLGIVIFGLLMTWILLWAFVNWPKLRSVARNQEEDSSGS